MIKTVDPFVLSDRKPEGSIGFYPEDILRNGSFCLEEDGDVALFEKESDGVYSGHYFFRSGGRVALERAKRFLEFVFSDDARVIKGLTPVHNKKALWFTRKLGFKMLDVLETPLGEMQLSMLIKKDYK